MDKKLISVLMPVYKPKIEYLQIAVDSILHQTYTHFELLVLYEYTGDNDVKDFLYAFQDRRIRIVELQKGFGLPKSLNEGIRLAKGDYIARMDADDRSFPERFQKQLDYMEQHGNVDILGTTARIMGTSNLEFERRGMTPEMRAIRLMFRNYGICHPTAFIRKRFFEETNIRYNEEIRGSEDYHLWVDAVIAGARIESMDAVLLDYRVYEEQATQRLAKEMVEWDRSARRKLWDLFQGFTDEEIDVIAEIDNIGKRINPTELAQLVRKLINLNRKIGFYDRKLLKNEMAFHWVYRALLLFKHEHDLGLLTPRLLLCIISAWNIPYILKQLMLLKRKHVYIGVV